jgi:hypothetical protein
MDENTGIVGLLFKLERLSGEDDFAANVYRITDSWYNHKTQQEEATQQSRGSSYRDSGCAYSKYPEEEFALIFLFCSSDLDCLILEITRADETSIIDFVKFE